MRGMTVRSPCAAGLCGELCHQVPYRTAEGLTLDLAAAARRQRAVCIAAEEERKYLTGGWWDDRAPPGV